MKVCDRCRCPDPMYSNVYISAKNHDLCKPCYKEYEKLEEVFISIEQTFMNNKNLKHIDLQWEDAQ